MTDNERIQFIQDNSIRISHRENGFWSAEIPHGTWVSRATLVEAIDELYRVVNLTPEQSLADMYKVAKAELLLKEEHEQLYGKIMEEEPPFKTPEEKRRIAEMAFDAVFREHPKYFKQHTPKGE